jgi:SAM-dependent methyltransferase
MEEIRRAHNTYKRDLIQSVTREGDQILDVGCGCGGDLQKWRHAGANISMCDPSEQSLEEAKSRARNLKMRVNFYHGDIFACPNRKYDIICFNFSLHYIFASEKLFKDSIREIRNRMKPGGKLIGIIPDSESILYNTPIQDDLGNFFKLKTHGNGGFGEKLFVELVDTPYYADGPKSEPVAYKDMLIHTLENSGFKMNTWEALTGSHISRLYSKFIFTYRK